MVVVRFASVKGVEAGIKCTLDGVAKYTDEIGQCSFFGISSGPHTYSVEPPTGWKFDYGEDLFGDPIPQSGTTVIEHPDLPGTPWPEATPWTMKFGFVEEAALGEFRFVAWSLLDRREIITLDINGDKYDPGMTVKVKHKAKNVGDGASKAVVEVRDADTGDYVTSYGSGATPLVEPGGTWRVDEVEIGKMPKKDWRLEFKVTP